MSAVLEQCTHRAILEVGEALRMPVNFRLGLRVEALLGRGERRILLDLSRLSDLDAAGVGELVRAFNTTSAAGGVLQIAHAGRRVRHLLQISGVFELLATGADRMAPG